MSWDLFVVDLPHDLMSIEDLPEDFKFPSYGTRTEISTRILEVVPMANFSNPAWGTIDRDGWSIEVNIGEEGPIECFALHVRGGDGAADCVAAMLDHLKLRAFDTASDNGLFSGGSESLERWREYRDLVLNGRKPPSSPTSIWASLRRRFSS